MKKVKVEVYEASDGNRFETEKECIAHEAKSSPLSERLAAALGMPGCATLIGAALGYESVPVGARHVAALIEEAARKCAESRLAGGGAKRKMKPKETPDAAPPVGEKEPTLDDVKREFDAVNGPTSPLAGRQSTKDNPFPAHGPRLVGAQPSTGFDGPTAAE